MAKGASATSTPTIKSRSDVYTVLVIIATLTLLMGTAFLIYRSKELFDQWLPMGIPGQT